jgi:hypothetical protein
VHPIGQADLSLSSEDPSPLDDEVEVPDEEEDDVPDDLGQALDDNDDDSVPLTADLDAPNPELLAPASRPHIFEGASGGWARPRFLSLGRFRC